MQLYLSYKMIMSLDILSKEFIKYIILSTGDEIGFELDYKLIDCNVHVLPHKFYASGYGKV